MPDELKVGPFRIASALASGITLSTLRGPAYRQVLTGVYVTSDTPDDLETRCRAAQLLLPPTSVFSHTTAAHLLDLPVPTLDELVHVSVPRPEMPAHIDGVFAHESIDLGEVDGGEFLDVRGLAVSTAARTFIHLAPLLDLVELVALGDAMVRRGLLTVPALRRVADSTKRRRGVVAARDAARLVRPGVDSAMETRVRLLLVLAGFPEPVVGLDLVAPDGRWIARPDLSWPEWKVALEYDGDTHRLDRKQWRDDVHRRELLAEIGWRLVVGTYDDLTIRTTSFLGRTESALRSAGCPFRRDFYRLEWMDFFGRGRIRH